MAKKAGDHKAEGPRQIQNRRAGFEYDLVERYEAGIVLVGSEVKSIFSGNANLTDAYCQVKDSEIFIVNMEIQPYSHTSAFIPERRRERKLLMHRREIAVLQRQAKEKGFALVPTRVYFKNGRVKVEVAVGRGRKQYDKRQQIAEKEERREKERARSKEF